MWQFRHSLKPRKNLGWISASHLDFSMAMGKSLNLSVSPTVPRAEKDFQESQECWTGVAHQKPWASVVPTLENTTQPMQAFWFPNSSAISPPMPTDCLIVTVVSGLLGWGQTSQGVWSKSMLHARRIVQTFAQDNWMAQGYTVLLGCCRQRNAIVPKTNQSPEAQRLPMHIQYPGSLSEGVPSNLVISKSLSLKTHQKKLNKKSQCRLQLTPSPSLFWPNAASLTSSSLATRVLLSAVLRAAKQQSYTSFSTT